MGYLKQCVAPAIMPDCFGCVLPMCWWWSQQAVHMHLPCLPMLLLVGGGFQVLCLWRC